MLKRHGEFALVYNRGKAAHSKSSVLFYLPKEDSRRVGFTASKKVGNAVKRNFSKRRMRALFSEVSERLRDGEYVYVAKPTLQSTRYTTLQKDLRYMLKRLDATEYTA